MDDIILTLVRVQVESWQRCGLFGCVYVVFFWGRGMQVDRRTANDQADCEESEWVERRKVELPLAWGRQPAKFGSRSRSAPCVRVVACVCGVWDACGCMKESRGKRRQAGKERSSQNAPLMIQGCSTDTAIMA